MSVASLSQAPLSTGGVPFSFEGKQRIESNYKAAFERQRLKAQTLRQSGAEQRIAKLRRLRECVIARRSDIHAALAADLGRPSVEADLTELLPSLQEIGLAIRQLRGWMRPQRVSGTLGTLGTRSQVRAEPKGVCLLIAPWNFPLNLVLMPLASAIAAGNTVIVKPSEYAPQTSALVLDLLAEVFEADEVTGFEGGREVSESLLALPFDHIFFTGSTAVGRQVMAAAANHLASVTLELGGKTPVIVDQWADVQRSARSIAFGKHQNAGQACIAPDHVYVHEAVYDQWLHAYREAVTSQLGTADRQQESSDLGRIISQRHATRLKTLLDDAIARGARVWLGGQTAPEQRYIQPTVLIDVPDDALMMSEEIFGPLLPVIRYSDLSAPLQQINARPKPLALYVYSQDSRRVEDVIARTSAGTSCVNTCMIQYAQHHLPFGGVNASGMGRAHGLAGFREFSNMRSLLYNRFSMLDWLAPPYTKWTRRLARWALRWL